MAPASSLGNMTLPDLYAARDPLLSFPRFPKGSGCNQLSLKCAEHWTRSQEPWVQDLGLQYIPVSPWVVTFPVPGPQSPSALLMVCGWAFVVDSQPSDFRCGQVGGAEIVLLGGGARESCPATL